MASGKDFETLHAMYKNITEQLQAIKHQTKSPSISNFRPYESSHMERSTDLKGRHMLLSTTIRDTLMFTSYSSCPSLASALLGLCSHGSKGKKNACQKQRRVCSHQGKGPPRLQCGVSRFHGRGLSYKIESKSQFRLKVVVQCVVVKGKVKR